MSVCNVQDLLTDARCFYNLSAGSLSALTAELWCMASEVISPPTTNPALQSDDGLWYQINAIQTAPGDATINIPQVAVPPGAAPYLVILNLDDGLKYKFRLFGSPPSVVWDIEEVPTAEAETATVIDVGGTQYNLNIVTDGGLTVQLTPV